MRGVAVAATALLAAAAGCMSADDRDPASAPRLVVPAPATWPPYPEFSEGSCWARPSDSPRPIRFAPSYAPPRRARPLAPESAVRGVLRGLGDDSAVRAIELGPPPPVTRQHTGYFGRSQPPRGSLWAYIAVDPLVEDLPEGARPHRKVAAMRAQWELALAQGALHDAFCAAGGRPLVGASAGGGGVSFVPDAYNAIGQRFPNPRAGAYRRHVAAVAAGYDLDVVAVRFVRPLQVAPDVVLRSDDRKRVARDAGAVVHLLDPVRRGRIAAAAAFEGFFLEVRDEGGEPFLAVARNRRGQASGGQWAWDPCYLPYAHRGGLLPGRECPEDASQ